MKSNTLKVISGLASLLAVSIVGTAANAATINSLNSTCEAANTSNIEVASKDDEAPERCHGGTYPCIRNGKPTCNCPVPFFRVDIGEEGINFYVPVEMPTVGD